MDDLILRFFRDDIGGILIVDAEGNVLYEDAKTAFVQREKTNWKTACPPPGRTSTGKCGICCARKTGRPTW